MKSLIIALVVVCAVVFAGAILKDAIVKTAVEQGVSYVTGLKLKVDAFKVGILKQVVDIRGLRLSNPAGYAEPTMIDMPQIYVDYDLQSAMKGKVHIRDMVIDLSEFTVVRNERGALNLDALKVAKEGKQPAARAQAEPQKMPEIAIDRLRLRIGKAVYKDHSLPVAVSKEFNVNIDQTYTNITDPKALVSMIVMSAIMKTNIASLANFDVSGLNSLASSGLATATKTLSDTTQAAQAAVAETVKQTQQAQEAAKETAQAVKNTAASIKGALGGLPFGSKQE